MDDEERTLKLSRLKQSILGNAFVAAMFSILASLYLFFPRRGGSEPYFTFDSDIVLIIIAGLIAFPLLVLFFSWLFYFFQKRKLESFPASSETEQH